MFVILISPILITEIADACEKAQINSI